VLGEFFRGLSDQFLDSIDIKASGFALLHRALFSWFDGVELS
jgi:hypothetical protein